MTIQKDILQLMADKGIGTSTAVFNTPTKNVQAIYKHRKEIFCLNAGEDYPFEDLNSDEQVSILERIKNDKFTISRSFQ